MGLNTYFGYAENDYAYLLTSYQRGDVANMMGAMAQGICEKYMKHLVSEGYEPNTEREANNLKNILCTHNLLKLVNFLDEEMDIRFTQECENEMAYINGYYFSARYPGDDSFYLTQKNIDHAMRAAELCREEVIEICGELGIETVEQDEEELSCDDTDEFEF